MAYKIKKSFYIGARKGFAERYQRLVKLQKIMQLAQTMSLSITALGANGETETVDVQDDFATDVANAIDREIIRTDAAINQIHELLTWDAENGKLIEDCDDDGNPLSIAVLGGETA